MRGNDPGEENGEDRFNALLAAHNWEEETGLYPRLDDALTDADRADIFQRMKVGSVDAALREAGPE